MWVLLMIVSVVVVANARQNVLFKSGAYEGVTVTVDDNIPPNNCKTVLTNLETTLTSSSHYLFTALDGRAFFQSININLPASWPDTCVPGGSRVTSSTGGSSDVTIERRSTPGVSSTWTQQSAGCELPGDQIYINYESLETTGNTLGRSLVKEWAKYRYGVFDEIGYINDLVYPMCYVNDPDKSQKITGCSDFPINDHGLCNDPKSSPYNLTALVDEKARTSIMFAAEAPTVSMFCDDGNHNKQAPTKHNSLCGGRSTLDVILKHPDFLGNGTQNISEKNQNVVDTRPTFVYKKHTLTRYVLIIEDTSDMLLRESWSFLRSAIRKWAVFDLPANTEVGLVLANDTGASVALKISNMLDPSVRDLVASNIPYMPGDSRAPACLKCAITEALQMLDDRSKSQGPASSVILVIAPGMDYSMDLTLIEKATEMNIRMATINYPGVLRQQPLDILATETDGVAFSIYEDKFNQMNSLLSTYFKLTNVMYNIASKFFEGSRSDFPMEIHRREITDDGRNSVTGSFVLSPEMGEPARFSVFTHNTETPLIRSITLVSPNQITYSDRSDSLLSVKLLTVPASINETGTWTYTLERYPGNPQPHYVQVFATPRSVNSNVIAAKFWTRRLQNSSIFVLYTEIKRGTAPVLAAKVEVTVSRVETNGTSARKERFELLDTGSGDPDITKGDGIYTRYYNTAPGFYTFDVTVTDNGNAYSRIDASVKSDDKPCCGSSIPAVTVTPLSPFQRVLPPISLSITADDVRYTNPSVGRVGDLRVQILADEQKARLTWTAPDMGGVNVARYEIKYAFNVEDVTDKFQTAAIMWDNGTPFPLAAGSETTFTLDLSQDPSFLDKPLYFALRSYSLLMMNAPSSPVSNWVRVYIPAPPAPSTVPPTYESPDLASWPYQNENEVEAVIPRIAQRLDFGLELILPIIGGVLLLAVLLAVYCYFCVLKRRDGNHHKKSPKHTNERTLSGITIVPQGTNSNGMSPGTPNRNYIPSDTTDHHTIGLPINYSMEDEPKKRYSIVHQQEQQLIEELKHQQMQHQLQRESMQTPNNTHGNLSVISNNTLQRNGRTLSPYESWTASQLLHEHERRHSPMDDLMNQGHLGNDTTGLNMDHLSLNGQNMDHISNGGQDNMGINGQQMSAEHYGQNIMAPPVPPLPTYNANGYPVNYPIYGVHQNVANPGQNHNTLYQTAIHRNGTLVPFNPSLQGSLNSVNSGEKKRRNVTMV